MVKSQISTNTMDFGEKLPINLVFPDVDILKEDSEFVVVGCNNIGGDSNMIDIVSSISFSFHRLHQSHQLQNGSEPLTYRLECGIAIQTDVSRMPL